MFFWLNFKLWDEVDVDMLKWEKRPVGKLFVQVHKLNRPARWKQLWLEDTPKPENMKLWFDKHQKYHFNLEHFELDDIDDFPGHDLIETETYEYLDDQTYLFPPKGPGEFAALKNKKKKKKSGKKKLAPKSDL